MNVENIHTTRDAILAAGPDHFHMNTWSTANADRVLRRDCGTAACIGGWACALADPDPNNIISGSDVYSTTTLDFLDIDQPIAEQLFEPQGLPGWDVITPRDAADVLDHLVTTGEVDWLGVMTRNHPEMMLDAQPG